MADLQLAVIDVKPGAALESQSGLQMLRPRIYGAYMAPPGPKKVACIVMHPTSNFMGHYLIAPLAARDICCMGLNSRYAGNDTVLLMASGASGVRPDPEAFQAAVTAVCHDLAQQLVRDAEGADHDIAVEVVRAASEEDAVEVGRAVARSNLFKAAVFGRDPNWGRVLAAVGTTSAAFDPRVLDVAMNGVWVCQRSTPAADRSEVDLSGRELSVTIDLKAGTERATVWTNDLTHAYVHENSAYSS